MKRLLPLFLSVAVGSGITGCSNEEQIDTPRTEDPPSATSEKQRLLVSAPSADLTQAVKGQTEFALDLYKNLAKPDQDNLFLSPYSISVALSMTYAGAKGSTAQAFENVFKTGLASAPYHRAMNDLDAQLTSRGQNAKAADGKPFRLVTVNNIFAQEGFPVEKPFLDTLAQEYGSGVRLLNFIGATETARTYINQWVETKTENKITNLLAPGILTVDTRLVLVNAIYFNAAWKQAFNKANTSDKEFHLLDGTTKRVPFMAEAEMAARGALVNGVEVFELDYDGRELSMLVMMPPAGQFTTFEQSLTENEVASYRSALRNELLNLNMPKFEMKVGKKLKTPLSDLGLGIAFSEGADLSGISTAQHLAISEVVHQAYVKVNESGTEAAAATAVVIGVDTAAPNARYVSIDRPFIFAVRDNATGAIVFLGRVTNP